jgi:hypothetical protein
VNTAAAVTAQLQFTADHEVGIAFSNVNARDSFLAARSEKIRVVAR